MREMSTHSKTIIILSGDAQGPNVSKSLSGMMYDVNYFRLFSSSLGKFKNRDEIDEWWYKDSSNVTFTNICRINSYVGNIKHTDLYSS